MDHKFPGTEIETKIMQHLVAALGGHAVTVIRPGVGDLLGFSVKGRTVVVRDMLEDAGLSTDAEPTIYVSRKSLEELLEAKGSHVALQTLIHRKPLKSGNGVALYAAPFAGPVKTAPAVAVKALEWKEIDLRVGEPPVLVWEAKTPFMTYTLESIMDRPWFCHFICAHFTDLDEAKAAAQADYEARILSALSAQVQDVAGWQSMDSAPKDGSEFVAGRRYAPDGEFVVHTYKWVGEPNYWSSKRNGVCIRPPYQADFLWCRLPTSPAPKHGWKDPTIFDDAEGRN